MNNEINKLKSDFEVNLDAQEFKKMLESHDWYFYMSDNNDIYQVGYDYEQNLKKLAKQSSLFQELYNKEKEKHFK